MQLVWNKSLDELDIVLSKNEVDKLMSLSYRRGYGYPYASLDFKGKQQGIQMLFDLMDNINYVGETEMVDGRKE